MPTGKWERTERHKQALSEGQKKRYERDGHVYSTEYVNVHKQIVALFGEPEICEQCGTTEHRRYEWANVTGIYNRERVNWKRMCVPCHRKLDGPNLKPDAFKGHHHTAEAKASMSRKLTGRKISPEAIEKIRIANTGKHLSSEARAKISQTKKDRKQGASPERMAEIRERRKRETR
jgi:hypothetical protein